MKRVLLVVIDALSSRVVLPALERGDLPNFAALGRAGQLHPNCISIFPSITPAATAAIVTGCYPAEHGIAGAYWYDIDQDHVIYYSDDIWTIMRLGPGTFFDEFLRTLNEQRLSAPTLYQKVERAGMQAACLNYMIFHGDVPHRLHVPLVLRLLPGTPEYADVHGPSMLFLGDFVSSGFARAGKLPNKARGLQHRLGVDDAHTAEVLLYLARQRALPELTLAYLPDNDFDSHEVGPCEALRTLRQVDTYLGALIDAYGGLEPLLQEVCIILTGDHSQCDMLDENAGASIDLNAVLAGFTLAEAGVPWGDDDDLMACLNLRTAMLYLRQPVQNLVERVVADLLADPRIDQVMWSRKTIAASEHGYMVATRDRGTLHFWPGEDGPQTARDAYGFTWSWHGDLRSVDGHVGADSVVTFSDYPNAFERITCGLNHEDAGNVWVTARPGYAFHLPTTSGDEVHAGGGSHGSLHALDSTVPLLVAGAPADLTLPALPRTVDVAPICLQVLGLEPRSSLGASHVARNRDRRPA